MWQQGSEDNRADIGQELQLAFISNIRIGGNRDLSDLDRVMIVGAIPQPHREAKEKLLPQSHQNPGLQQVTYSIFTHAVDAMYLHMPILT